MGALPVRVSASKRLAVAGDGKEERPAVGGDGEVGSVGLDRMVLSFMEDSTAVERPARPPRRATTRRASMTATTRIATTSAAGDTLEALKGLVQSASASTPPPASPENSLLLLFYLCCCSP